MDNKIKPIFIFATDWHLRHDNTETIKDLAYQLADLALEKGVQHIVIGGDFFDNRTNQRLITLKAAKEIFGILSQYDLTVHAIAGNHDKSSYSSAASFIDIYNNNIHVYNDMSAIIIEDVVITFLPFFEEPMLKKKLEKAVATDILVSHFEAEGAIMHPDGVNTRVIPTELLTKFKKVFLGHIHNYQEIEDFIYQLPSIKQNNFGEDDFKGFTIVYNDLSHQVIRSKFKKYKTVKINLDEDDEEKIREKINLLADEDVYKRAIVSGSEEMIKTFNKDRLSDFKVSFKQPKRDIKISLDAKDILLTFKEFCEINGLDYDEGLKYFIEAQTPFA